MSATSKTMIRVVYLHGFRSSPLSAKSRLLLTAFSNDPKIQFSSPQLPPSPKEALRVIEAAVLDTKDAVVFVGSSLGGFYATVLVERYPDRDFRAMLLNPGIHPARDLRPYIGEHAYWHRPEEKYSFTEEHVRELDALERELQGGIRNPMKYGGVFCKGDEVIDWKEMNGRYSGSNHVLVVDGSDHGISDFETYLSFVVDFIHRKL